MKQTSSKISKVLVLLLLAVFMLTGLTGCGSLFGTSKRRVQPPTVTKKQPNLRVKAEKAWAQKDYARSEELYRRLLDTSGLTHDQRVTAYERLTLSALENQHYRMALETTSRWVAFAPEAQGKDSWQNAYFAAVRNLGNAAQRQQLLTDMAANQLYPWAVRTRATVALAANYLRQGNVQQTTQTLSELPDTLAKDQRGMVEEYFFVELENVGMENIEALEMITPEEEKTSFPYIILQLERARRLALSKATWTQALALLDSIQNYLANRALAQSVLGTKQDGEQAQGLALLLPLTGAYGSVGSKIVRGAGVAQWELAQQGISLDLQVVNTESQDWQQSLDALPDTVSIVGGPLRVDKMKEVISANLIKKKPFFAFLSGLGDAQEGYQAWRFFSSPRDQIRALLNTATTKYLAFSSSVLYPSDNYGARMAQMFQHEAKLMGVNITSSDEYPTTETYNWGQYAHNTASSGAGAVFIPGDWAQAEIIVPYLLYHGAGDMLIMGTTIWGRALARKKYAEMPSFSKAIFPASWWDLNPSPAAQALRTRLQEEGLGAPDFWVALGYDFVRFAMHMGATKKQWTPKDINSRLQGAQMIDWSMAPMSWDVHGVAQQKLFMFRPTQNGFTRLDAPEPTMDEEGKLLTGPKTPQQNKDGVTAPDPTATQGSNITTPNPYATKQPEKETAIEIKPETKEEPKKPVKKRYLPRARPIQQVPIEEGDGVGQDETQID